MNPLVHQRTPAIERPGPTPPGRPKIIRRTIPLETCFAQGKPSQFSRVHRSLEILRCRIEAILKDHTQPAICSLSGRDHLVGFLQGDLHRLFDQHVLPRLEGRERRLGVETAGRADAHRLDLRVHNGLPEIGAPGRAIQLGQLARLLGCTAARHN